MLVANAFDLWQKDAFFSAAEEVQESADLMGSTYRAWVREMDRVETPEAFSDLSRDLQTALGTAKWQLEELERAVRLSQGPYVENITSARHGQFIAAIRDQIASVEAALCQSLSKGGQPLRWVNLDKDERDDLALFLSGTPKSKKSSNDEFLPKGMAKKAFNRDGNRKEEGNSYFCEQRVLVNDVKSLGDGKLDQTTDCVIEKEGKDNLDRTVGASRTWNSPSVGDWRIIVADGDGRDKLLPKVDVTPKIKGYKAPFWKARCGLHSPPKSLNGLFNKLFGRSHSLPRQSHLPRNLQPSRSVQLMLVVMLMMFLIVKSEITSSVVLDVFSAVRVLLLVKFSAAQDPPQKQAAHFSRCHIYHRNAFATLLKKIEKDITTPTTRMICGFIYSGLQNRLTSRSSKKKNGAWRMLAVTTLCFPTSVDRH